jgi:hypothetical protein
MYRRKKDWSPKTTIMGIRVLFWKLACNRAYGAKVQRWYHARLRKKSLLQNVKIPDTTAGIVTKLKEAMSKWIKYSKAEAEEDRNTLLQKKATAIAEEKNTTMENITKKLRLREDKKRSATQIKMVRGKLRSGGVSRVTYLDDNGVVNKSTGRGHLEECNKANEAKFEQTADTPFMTGVLQEDVGWLGIGPAVCMMLDGTYEPPAEVDEYTKKFIKQFRQNRKATEYDPSYKITPEEKKSLWKGATERTSCGCDILYFGTWKAGSSSDTIMELDALLTYIPLQTVYSTLRWRVAINALLLKKAGVILVEKLRTIVLFQGDLNYLNKYIGHHMMKDAEEYEHLAWEQYGSLEGKNAIDQALNKVLFFDLIRQAREDAAMCSNDVKSCYDRIVHAIASILMQQQNVPASACMCVFTMLHKLYHTVRTIYGDSKSGYGGTLWAVPYSGVGQGNGADPVI